MPKLPRLCFKTVARCTDRKKVQFNISKNKQSECQVETETIPRLKAICLNFSVQGACTTGTTHTNEKECHARDAANSDCRITFAYNYVGWFARCATAAALAKLRGYYEG